jgi:hypothetical protein
MFNKKGKAVVTTSEEVAVQNALEEDSGQIPTKDILDMVSEAADDVEELLVMARMKDGTLNIATNSLTFEDMLALIERVKFLVMMSDAQQMEEQQPLNL